MTQLRLDFSAIRDIRPAHSLTGKIAGIIGKSDICMSAATPDAAKAVDIATTDYHAKYYACELTRRYASDRTGWVVR